ncbi:hypothetical protein B0T11DRAFT_330845 [Plectosphaerella cucumerina]|uniref:Altered inheritance of mitochondria protein 9, mitochondrial n=1 Tax=Plectosphaerella cucumerina TaxID=40658 RepID=A0A8K0X3T8_9PEZI|nr:hypothetical protein B0T11DRAFT_330845 [Plectosphaerella cucumerina]
MPTPKAEDMHHIEWQFHNVDQYYIMEWPNPPQIKYICTVLNPFLKDLGLGHDPQVEFLSSGGYHKVFQVRRRDDCQSQPQVGVDGSETLACPSYVFRVALPACPFYKTASEVATMSYVRQHTSVPVPRVYAYDASSDNALGHEWILMEMIEGASTFRAVEYDASIEQKLKMARQVADWTHQLSQLCFNSIGSLYFEDDLPVQRQNSTSNDGVTFLATAKIPRSGPVLVGPISSLVYCLGPVVGDMFNSDWRTEYDFNRGPYPSVAAFIDAILDMHRLEIGDDRQRARSEMAEAVHDAWWRLGRTLRQLREDDARIRAEWMAKTEARIGGPLDPRVCWLGGWPYHVKVNKTTNNEINEFDHATEDAVHLKRALEAAEFDMIRQDLRADPSSCRLFAWDMSVNNVLVESNTKEPVAVIDWEQIVFVPPYLVDFYPKVVEGPGPNGDNDDLTDPTRSELDLRQDKDCAEWFVDCDAKLMREEFRNHLFSLDPTALDMYEARWSEFRPADEEMESKDMPEGPDSGLSKPAKPRTSLPLDLWSIASPGKRTERRVENIAATMTRAQSHPAALGSGGSGSGSGSGLQRKGSEDRSVQRQRAAEATLRKTFDRISAPMHIVWKDVEDMYSDLGYKVTKAREALEA